MASIHQPDDKAFKALLQTRKAFLQLLRCFLHESWVAQLDEQALHRIDKSFILPDFSSRESDIVYRCRFQESEVIFYVLLELQSSVDHQMPWRLLQYMVEIWRMAHRDTEQAHRRRIGFRLPPIVPIVVYNGKQGWTAQRRFRDYLQDGETFGSAVPDFTYHLVDIKRWKPEDMAQLSGILPVALHLENASDLGELTDRIKASFDAIRRLDDEETGLLSAFIHRILLPMAHEASPEDMDRFIEQSALLDAEGRDDMVSQISKKIYQEAKALVQKGLDEGLEKGRVEGRVEGMLAERQALVRRMQQNGLTADQIAAFTGLSLDEIKAAISAGSIEY